MGVPFPGRPPHYSTEHLPTRRGDSVDTAGIRGELAERTTIMATSENSEKVGLQQGCTHVNSEQGPSECNTHKRKSSLVLEGQKAHTKSQSLSGFPEQH